MHQITAYLSLVLGVLTLSPFVAHGALFTPRGATENTYSRAHSLPDGYKFDPRDGWQTINATNLPYKYPSSEREGGTRKATRAVDNFQRGSAIGAAIDRVVKLVGLKGFGKPEAVEITWYNGHDLENPSCWSNGKWSPTDHSFACALTRVGWQNRPKCFQFLEICNGPKKCVFVRVVDSCAGCAPGSKHIDLTRDAFKQLADLAEGVVQVQFRLATEPTNWIESLWGPKV